MEFVSYQIGNKMSILSSNIVLFLCWLSPLTLGLLVTCVVYGSCAPCTPRLAFKLLFSVLQFE